jgi:Arc/MetJ-type ribon-helix-helix transcriptional regulator
MVFDMKRFLVELDERSARDLERVAPSRSRKRSEFVRLAIRRSIDLALDRATAAAYREQPLDEEITPGDLAGWDDDNELARPAKKRAKKRAE